MFSKDTTGRKGTFIPSMIVLVAKKACTRKLVCPAAALARKAHDGNECRVSASCAGKHSGRRVVGGVCGKSRLAAFQV
jgi:hypothetical protein